MRYNLYESSLMQLSIKYNLKHLKLNEISPFDEQYPEEELTEN